MLLLCRARPGPLLRCSDESGFSWIVFDVPTDLFALGGRPHPVVKGFTLPKGLAHSLENTVCLAAAHTFDAARDAFERQTRLDQEMDVIGHDDIRQ